MTVCVRGFIGNPRLQIMVFPKRTFTFAYDGMTEAEACEAAERDARAQFTIADDDFVGIDSVYISN